MKTPPAVSGNKTAIHDNTRKLGCFAELWGYAECHLLTLRSDHSFRSELSAPIATRLAA